LFIPLVTLIAPLDMTNDFTCGKTSLVCVDTGSV